MSATISQPLSRPSTALAVGSPAARHGSAVSASILATLLAGLLATAGLRDGTSPVVVAGASAFLWLAVACDLRARRIPNLLTLPALAAALVTSSWAGGASGPLQAALGASLALLVLVGPYAVGGMGAGDVKALMALGAWIGPAALMGAIAWSLVAAGILGLVLLLCRGELPTFFRRWKRIVVVSLGFRRIAYERPEPGSAASGGIPFAAAIALGLAAFWAGGSPWS